MPFYEYQCAVHGHSVVSATFGQSITPRVCKVEGCNKPLKKLFSSYTFNFKF